MHPDTFAAGKVEFSDLGLGQVRGGNLGGLLKSSPRLSLSFFVDKVSGSALDRDSVFLCGKFDGTSRLSLQPKQGSWHRGMTGPDRGWVVRSGCDKNTISPAA